ncbi:hypothetical protein [Castellaniella sp.]|uniref:hypothetical protein n=1 Tax=Castellaniella sp. TaxID=1955812 RepID=UPI00355D12F4
MAQPPKLAFARIAPLQDYYDDGCGNHYSVAKLLDDAKDLPVFDCPVAALDLSGEIWQDSNMFKLAWHVKKVMKADLSVPILLDWNGCVADGRHRIIKAIALGKRTIPARRMTWRPDPDHTERKE